MSEELYTMKALGLKTPEIVKERLEQLLIDDFFALCAIVGFLQRNRDASITFHYGDGGGIERIILEVKGA